MSKRSFRWRFV